MPSCAKEFANISLDVKTDDPPQSGVVGTKNVRIALRIMGGNSCAPNIVWWTVLPSSGITGMTCSCISSGIQGWDRGVYLDNSSVPFYSNRKIPTLFTRPKGYVSPSYTSLTVPNYRLHAPWSSTIYVGPLAVGSTQSSVLSAF